MIDPVDADLNRKLGEDEIAEKRQEAIEERAEEIARDILSIDGFKFKGAIYNASDVTEKIYSDGKHDKNLDNMLRMMAVSPIVWQKPLVVDVQVLMRNYAYEIGMELAETELQDFEINGDY